MDTGAERSVRALFPLYGQVRRSIVGDRFLFRVVQLRRWQTVVDNGLGFPVFFSGRFGNGHPIDNAEGCALFVPTIPGSRSAPGDPGDGGQFPVVYDYGWRFIVHGHHTGTCLGCARSLTTGRL